MSLVSKTAACIAMAALLVGCVHQPDEPPSPVVRGDLQFQVEVLKREAILKLVELGQKQAELEKSRANQPTDGRKASSVSNLGVGGAGMIRARYAQDTGGTSSGSLTERTPEQCALQPTETARRDCWENACPICSQLKGYGSFPNSEERLIPFTRNYIEGGAAAADTITDISRMIEQAP